MEARKAPKIVIRGIDKVIKRDLGKHRELLQQSKLSLLSFREAVSHQIKKKKHYLSLIGEGKFNDDSLRESVDTINVDIRAMSDKAKLADEEISHHTLIVDTLANQLKEYYENNGLIA